MKRCLMVGLFLFLFVSGVGAQNIPGMPDKVVTKDGCVVEKVKGTYRVTNPESCPDKQFVTYLNCFDGYDSMQPTEKTPLPKECEGVFKK